MKRISYLKYLKMTNKTPATTAKLFGWMMFKIHHCDNYFLFKTTWFARVLLWVAYLVYAFYLSTTGFFSLFKTNIITAKQQIEETREWKVEHNENN